MTITQAILLGFLCWFTQSNFIGGTLFGQISIKPFVAAFFCGLVTGHMADAMIIGSALQAVYIGAVAVGGVESMPSINLIQWFAIPAAIYSGGGVEVCITLALALSAINTPLTQIERNIVKVPMVHLQDRLCKDGNMTVAMWMPTISTLYNFVVDMVLIGGLCLIGTDMVVSVVGLLPAAVTSILELFNGLLPLLGFCMLLLMMIKSKLQFVFLVFGFMLYKSAGMSLIAITIVACCIAYIQYLCTDMKRGEA